MDNQIDPQREHSPLLEESNDMTDTPFTLNELDAVIDAQKNNKTPGPDGCRSELVIMVVSYKPTLFVGIIQ